MLARFLWVSFQLETICAQPTDAAILSTLEDLPEDLPETYNRHLEKLQHSRASSTTLYKIVFQILTAAQRPLTSEELRHAASVVPGTTAWDNKMLINKITKTIDACGSLLFVDEEESTVRFAHHSIKQHLLLDPIVSSVREYHVNLNEADVRLGEICVTYLNWDVLGLQLCKSNKNSQIQPINIPTALSPSSSTHFKLVNKVAIQLLKASRPSKYNLQHQLQKAANAAQEPRGEQTFTFLSYARDYWLYHSRDFRKASVMNEKSLSLWAHLVEGIPSLSLPWAPESSDSLGPRLLKWIIDNQHGALLHQVFDSGPRLYGANLFSKVWAEGRIVEFLKNGSLASTLNLTFSGVRSAWPQHMGIMTWCASYLIKELTLTNVCHRSELR